MSGPDTSPEELQRIRAVLEDVGRRLEREREERRRPKAFEDDAPTLATCQDLIAHAGHLGQDADAAIALGQLEAAQFLLDLGFSYIHQAEDCLASLRSA